MTSSHHVSLPLRSILDGLGGRLPGCDAQDETETAALIGQLGDLRTTLAKENAEHLADVSSLAILLVDHLSRNRLVGPKETMDVVDEILDLVRGGLGMTHDVERDADAAPEGAAPALRLIDGQRLGELLITVSMLSSEDVERALELQKMTGMRLGEALVEQGVLTKESVQAALRLQRNRRRHEDDVARWGGRQR